MRGFPRVVVVVLACMLLAPSVAYAQASISGIVRDTSGGVLPGVTVEAASPVLIEKVRTTVTDGEGRYQITDLRPGAYTVTFSLAGFNTFKRDGITLAGAGSVAVDAEMRVGALEETITVTGEAPVVDVQTVTRQSVLNAATIDALPTSRNYATLARLIPGTNSNVNDVGGGAIQDVGGSTTVHGSKNTDQRVTLNGINTMTLQAGGNIGGQIPDVGSAAEITIDTSSLGADLPTGGVRINFVPKDGGNTFQSSTFFTFTNESLQGDNFTEELQAAGLGAPNKVLKSWDLNESIGGPFKRDKVWFWFSARVNEADNQAPVLKNANAFNPNAWAYVPVAGDPGVNEGLVQQSSVRITWQATPKHKIAGTYKADRWCNCPNNISATTAPEAGRDRRFPRLRQEHLEWTSPMTSKLLLEAVGMHLYERWGNMHYRVDGGSLDNEQQEAAVPLLISVQEQSLNNLTYRSGTTWNNTVVPNFSYRAAASYVTGAHAFKAGFNRTHGYQVTRTYNFQPVSYRFNNGVPNRVTVYATPYTQRNHLDNDLGLYAQDRWTMDRLTLNLALRYDWFVTSFPEQTLGPGLLLPNRNITFPEQDNLNWKDVTWRSGFAYDLFGNGRTALKGAVNKYLLGQTLNGIGSSPNPIGSLVTNTTRSWNDANRNFVADCDLVESERNGECGPLANAAFGTVVPEETFDPELLRGFGVRPWNMEFTASLQHEVAPRMSVEVGYFRRIWGNFTVEDNVLVGPNDFSYFDVTAPSDPRLPGGGGFNVEGFRDVTDGVFGLEQNHLTLARKFGKQQEHFDGVDFTFNARLQNGLVLQAGTSTGKTMEDDCEVAAAVPESSDRPLGFCHRETPWQTQFKGYAVYTIPTVDVQVSGTFRSTPGAAVNANLTASNAYLAANSTLGRPLAGGESNITLGLLEPNTLFLDRRNELDVRFGKVLRFGRSRSVLSLDLFNALNTDVPIGASSTYSLTNAAAWLRPTSILNARMLKVSMNFDF